MVIAEPVGIKAAFGENPKSVYHEKNQAPSTRMGTAAIIREALYKAKEYLAQLEKHRDDPDETDRPEWDFKCEALLPFSGVKFRFTPTPTGLTTSSRPSGWPGNST